MAPKGRPVSIPDRVQVGLQLTRAQIDWLDKWADRHGLKRSAALRKILDHLRQTTPI